MPTPSTVSFLTDINTKIGATAAITAIVGAQYYNTHLPQNIATFPAMAFKVVSEQRAEDKGGPSDYKKMRVQFSCFATTVNGAEVLADAVNTAFDRYQATATVKFHQTFFENRTEAIPNFDTGIYQVALDYIFHIK